MATTPGYASAYKSTPQNLYTIATDQLGKAVATSVGRTALITFDTASAAAGGDITDNMDGTYSLAAGLDYLVTATAVLTNVTWADSTNPPILILTNTADGAIIGSPVPMSDTLTTVIPNTMTPITVAITAVAPDVSGVWTYPAQIIGATLTIQVIGGY